jgi:hypothetical protein
MSKRPGQPNLPLIYRGMRITMLVGDKVLPARITRATSRARFSACAVEVFPDGTARQVGTMVGLRRREYNTAWVKGWASPEAKMLQAQHLLLKD